MTLNKDALHPRGSIRQRVINTFNSLPDRIKEVHGYNYTYDKAVFTKMTSPVIITCPEHGDFELSMHAHLNSKQQGCPKCGIQKRANKKRMTVEEFIEKAKHRHNAKYTYKNIGDTYNGARCDVKVLCPDHGEFTINGTYHLSGGGCPRCCTNRQHTLETFIEKAKKVHRNKYDYSKVTSYANNKDKLTIICPEHGKFIQTAGDHLAGKTGCRSCVNATVCDNDMLYVWNVVGTNIYKIGVTSKRLGNNRIKKVAKAGRLDYDIIHMVACDNATTLETKLLKLGSKAAMGIIDGHTEFRVLEEDDINRLTFIIKSNFETKIGEPEEKEK